MNTEVRLGEIFNLSFLCEASIITYLINSSYSGGVTVVVVGRGLLPVSKS